MTIYSKRRGRRSLAAIAAAMLVASVLAVVAGSPAQAANTSFEVLGVDTDNDGANDAREFAGLERYETALRLAENFARAKGGRGTVPTVFVASGQTLVDSISVAGLAGYVDAPILLTPSDSLDGRTADFIEDYGVGTVYVLGGSAAVSDSVLSDLKALVNTPKVDRIAGVDRYATAAEIADMIDAESSWCGTDAASAVLINGASDMLAYGVAVQTIAYRLQLPVLMTAADELPDATAEYIDENDIGHVQIIGGTDAVSDDVVSALAMLGVNLRPRVLGDSAAAVSVELAKLASDGCGDDLGLVSNDRVALVRGNPDGVVAAPVLASSFADGYLVTPLIVGDTLPASVRDYLAATPQNIGANRLDLGIVAVGGTAAVSEATMDAAIDAAASTDALTVRIGAATDTNSDGVESASDPVRPDPARTGTPTAIDRTAAPPTGPMFTLYFSDDVEFGEEAQLATLLDEIRDIVEVNGVPAVVLNAARSSAGGACDNRRIDVTLGQALSHGDTISIAASGHKLGTGTDQRTIAPASATVMAAPADRTRPTVTVLAIAPANTDGTAAVDVANQDVDGFSVTFSDAGGFPVMAADSSLDADDFTFIPAAGQGTETTNVISTVAHTATTADSNKSFTATVTIGRPLAMGDRLLVKPGVIGDNALPLANVNAGTPGVAIRPPTSPRITSVLMSNLRHSKQNTWTVPATLVGGAVSDHVIRIAAKADGDAAGAAGNGWTMVFDWASTHSAAKPLDIDVRVDAKGERVTVRFNNGPATATLGDLLAALKANADFDSRFAAGFANCNTGRGTTKLGLVTTAAARDTIASSNGTGRTQFAIEVRFNAYVDTVDDAELLNDVLAAAARRAETTTAADGIRAAVAGGTIAVDGTITAGTAGGGLDLASLTPQAGPRTSVRYEATTAVVRNLPMARDLVTTAAGARLLDDNPATTDAAETGFRPVSAPVATGFALDVNTTTANSRVDEGRNGFSQVRISVSASVKARN